MSGDEKSWYQKTWGKYLIVAFLGFVVGAAAVSGGETDGPTQAEYNEVAQENKELEAKVQSLQSQLAEARSTDDGGDAGSSWDHEAFHANVTRALDHVEAGLSDTTDAIRAAENNSDEALTHASNASYEYDQAVGAVLDLQRVPRDDVDHAVMPVDLTDAVFEGRTAIAFAKECFFNQGADSIQRVLCDSAKSHRDGVSSFADPVRDHVEG